jgi:hypothetical protein
MLKRFVFYCFAVKSMSPRKIRGSIGNFSDFYSLFTPKMIHKMTYKIRLWTALSETIALARTLFNSAVVITWYLLLCFFKQLRMKFVIYLGLFNPSCIAGISSCLVFLTSLFIVALSCLRQAAKMLELNTFSFQEPVCAFSEIYRCLKLVTGKLSSIS